MVKPPEMMTHTCDVDVVVPAYNARDTIERTLASIAAQTLKPRQAIVVVDGSSDGTFEAAEAFRSSMGDVELQVIWQENGGAADARNRAIEASDATYLAFLDADDEWLPIKLERSLQVMDQEGVDLVAHDCLIIHGSHESTTDCAKHFRAGSDSFVSLYLRGYIATSTVVVRRQRVVEAGGFNVDLRSGQDFDLWLAIVGSPGTRHFVFGETLTWYHVTRNSISSHTYQRLQCAIRILIDRAPLLKGRGMFSKLAALLRAGIVHVQAFGAYRSQGHMMKAFAVLLVMPLTVSRTGFVIYRGELLWIWIAAAFLLYGYQFREFAEPIKRLIGLG